MTLEAKRISSSVLTALNTGSRQARVHSCYARTVNILCPDMTWLSLHPAGTPLHAYGITVEARDGTSAPGRFLGARPEEAVRVGSDAIDLGPGRLKVEVEGAEIWNGRLVPPGCFSEAELPGVLDALYGYVRDVTAISPFLGAVVDCGSDPGMERDHTLSALKARAEALVDEIEASWRSRSVPAALEAARKIVGLGLGLTPSGDDFLTGFFGAAYCFANDDAFRRSVFASMRSVIHRTSLPSFFMLKAALRGLYPEPLARLLISLMTRGLEDLRRAFDSLNRLGSTSGQDFLAGVLCYLQVSSLCGTAYAAS
jgi:hypothetical protein